MRSRSLIKFLAVPVAAAGIAAAAAAPAAHADTVYQLDKSGTVTLTVPESYVAQLAKAGVVAFPVPVSELSVSGPNKTVSITFNVTGGEADVNAFAGSVNLSGSFEVASITGHFVSLTNVQLDVTDAALVATPAGRSAPISLLDLSGVTVSSTPDATNPNTTFADTYDADSATMDASGAAYLNSALHSKAFVAGQAVGSVDAAWEVVYPA